MPPFGIASRALIAMLSRELASCEASIWRSRHFLLEDRVDLDLLAERRPQQLGDIEHGGVDVDMCAARSGWRRAKASRCWISSLQRSAAPGRSVRPVLLRAPARVAQAVDQRFGGAGDDRQHVVEVVRDAAGELADGVELLRLLQLVFGFARGGDVVIDQRRAADGALGIAQRPAADLRDESAARRSPGRTTISMAVECLAAQRARSTGMSSDQQRRDAVGMKRVC